MHFSSVPAVEKTLAPKYFANCIAVVPIPLVPPCINIVSSLDKFPLSNTLVHTVKKVSGIAAACINDNPLGMGKVCCIGALQ